MQKEIYHGLNGVRHGLLFYEHCNKKLLTITVTQSILLIITLLALLYTGLREQKPVYFGVNAQMQVLPLSPLDDPIYTDGAIASWASEAASAIFNLDFVHYKEQIAANRQYFTKQAFRSFRKSLADEGHLTILQQYRAIMHGVPQGVPIIVAAGVLDNRMTWELEVPFALAYETSEKILSQQQYTLILRIQRVSTAEYIKGIAIQQILVSRERH